MEHMEHGCCEASQLSLGPPTKQTFRSSDTSVISAEAQLRCSSFNEWPWDLPRLDIPLVMHNLHKKYRVFYVFVFLFLSKALVSVDLGVDPVGRAH